MATITYKCDTCNRQVELIENKCGLTTYGRCTITSGCNGKFYKIKRNQNNSRESFPAYEPDIEDYSARKYLYIYNQKVPSQEWNVVHNFGLSAIAIVYNSNGEIIDSSLYTVEYFSNSLVVKFTSATTGYVHVIFRSASIQNQKSAVISPDVPLSYSNILTFAIPKFITRINSIAYPTTPQATPVPTRPALPSSAPYEVCNNTIKIEIELLRPNQEPIVCTETLDEFINPDSPWADLSQILVRNRKHYCIKTIDITKLKIFTNTNNPTIDIPNGTTLKIKRIDYGTGILTNIPDRGLILLLADSPYTKLNKITDKLVECGELVASNIDSFAFFNNVLFASSNQVEKVYPNITKYIP